MEHRVGFEPTVFRICNPVHWATLPPVRKYFMFLCYYSKFPVSDAVLSLPLDRLIERTNHKESYFMGRSAKLNWLVSDLQKQPVHKPILLDIDHKTITGDTRLWACDILGIKTIPALVYQDQPGGVVIKDMVDFYQYTNVPQTSTLSWGPQDADFFTQQVTNYNVYHAEQSDMIGGYDSHRMFVSLEDRHWRTRVMWNWMNQHREVTIDRSWYLLSIDWRRYY